MSVELANGSNIKEQRMIDYQKKIGISLAEAQTTIGIPTYSVCCVCQAIPQLFALRDVFRWKVGAMTLVSFIQQIAGMSIDQDPVLPNNHRIDLPATKT